MTQPLQQCPTCHRVGGPEVLGTCGRFKTCAMRMVPIEPEHEIIIKCEPCDRIRCVSANKIMSGREIDLDMNCQRSALNCAAKFVPVEKVRTHVPKAK